jgi:hypothetical protein
MNMVVVSVFHCKVENWKFDADHTMKIHRALPDHTRVCPKDDLTRRGLDHLAQPSHSVAGLVVRGKPSGP